jgi:tetratricopeptide (TPR) repeat protein
MFSQYVCALALAAWLSARASVIDDALALQRQGKLQQARELLRASASELRTSADLKNQAKALSLASQISLSMGDYHAAISEAESAAEARQSLNDYVGIAKDFNTLGLANLYLGNYSIALSRYQQALKLDFARGNARPGRSIR